MTAWTKDHGPKIEIWDASLSTKLDLLQVDDAGYDIAFANGVVGASGIDLHVWRPGSGGSAFSLQHSSFAPPGETGSCALSDDGAWVGVVHDRMGNDEPQAMWLRTSDLGAPPIVVFDEIAQQIGGLAFAPGAEHVALSVYGSPIVRVHRVVDGEVVAEASVPRSSCVGWLGERTLLVGGDPERVVARDLERDDDRRPLRDDRRELGALRRSASEQTERRERADCGDRDPPRRHAGPRFARFERSR